MFQPDLPDLLILIRAGSRLFDVLAAGIDSRFNPLAGCGRDALAIENEKA
jgi:hypothetical protein